MTEEDTIRVCSYENGVFIIEYLASILSSICHSRLRESVPTLLSDADSPSENDKRKKLDTQVNTLYILSTRY